jgi:hypothetical protein
VNTVSPSRRRRRASPAWEGRATIRVATIPGRGLYARHLGHPEGVDAVHRTTVGLPCAARPRARFDRRWAAQALAGVDVVHLLGPPPGVEPDDIAATVDAVRANGTPLVVTGYHLSDPAGGDPAAHAARLDALVPRADAVVTLTESAADEMRVRWGVEPVVLPHPHAVDFVRMRQERPQFRSGTLRVGTHLATLRLPVDPVMFVDALTRAVRGVEEARLVVHLHDTVLDAGSNAYAPGVVRALDDLVTGVGGAVRVHRPFSESRLWDHLFSLDVSVVPGLHGSHSVWPEACSDLGTQPLLAAGTHAAEQRPCLTYDGGAIRAGGRDVEALADSLGKALWTAREQGNVWRANPEQRWAERVRVAESLRGLYERLLGLDRR